MTITMFYAGALALVFLALSLRVIQKRGGRGGISLGDGGDAEMLRRMRAHANFGEYVPLILLMMAFLESSGMPRWAIHAMGATLLLARLLHGYALGYTEKFIFGRFWGALLTLVLLLVAGLACLWQGVSGL